MRIKSKLPPYMKAFQEEVDEIVNKYWGLGYENGYEDGYSDGRKEKESLANTENKKN